jgi:hypothetical protein
VLQRLAIELYGALRDPVREAYAKNALAMTAFRQGDLETSATLTLEARGSFEAVDDLWGIALTSGQLGALALRRNDYQSARDASLRGLETNERLRNRLGVAVSLQALAVVAVRTGSPDAGVRLAGAVDRINEVAGGEAPSSIVGLEDPLELARESLPPDRMAALWREGRAMTMEDAIAYARREA